MPQLYLKLIQKSTQFSAYLERVRIEDSARIFGKFCRLLC